MQWKVPDSVVETMKSFTRDELVVFAYWQAWRAAVGDDSPGSVAELVASDVEEFLEWRSQP